MLTVDDKMLPLCPGMIASVEIKTGSRTMMEYVLSSGDEGDGGSGEEEIVASD